MYTDGNPKRLARHVEEADWLGEEEEVCCCCDMLEFFLSVLIPQPLVASTHAQPDISDWARRCGVFRGPISPRAGYTESSLLLPAAALAYRWKETRCKAESREKVNMSSPEPLWTPRTNPSVAVPQLADWRRPLTIMQRVRLI